MVNWLYTTGIEHQPGPAHNAPARFQVLDSINCTNLHTHQDHVLCGEADFTLLQEVSANPPTIANLKTAFREKGHQLLCTSTDTSATHFVGGVGGIAKNPKTFF